MSESQPLLHIISSQEAPSDISIKNSIADIVLDLMDEIEFRDNSTYEMLRGVAELESEDDIETRRLNVQFFNPDYQHGASGGYRIAKISTVVKNPINDLSNLTSFLLTYNPFSSDKYELYKVDMRKRGHPNLLVSNTEQAAIVLHLLEHFKPLKD